MGDKQHTADDEEVQMKESVHNNLSKRKIFVITTTMINLGFVRYWRL
jgi:hypothetical protein